MVKEDFCASPAEQERQPRTDGPRAEFRKHDWFDKVEFKVRYGIQARQRGEHSWRHCHRSGEVLLFDTPEARDAEITRLKEISRSEPASEDPKAKPEGASNDF